MQTERIPVIDIGPYFGGDSKAKREVARAVGYACESIGFLVIANHGLARELFDRAFAAGRVFFDQPDEVKARFKPADGVAPRGYHAVGTRSLAKTLGIETPPDLREQFFIGPLRDDVGRFEEVPGAARFYAPNIWPDHPPEYRPVFTELYQQMERLAADLMRIFALALDQPEDFFDDKIDHHFNTCPLNHYPAPKGDPLPGQVRAGEHTDFGSLTVLAIDDAPGGLQVKRPDGAWLDVQPAREHLVVNLGDMMARWTNDRWRSTLHRVVNPPVEAAAASRRMSLGHFLHPNYDAEVACIPSCCGPGNPARYSPIMAGEHMRMKMERRVAA